MTSFLQALWLVVLFNGNPVTLNPVATDDYVLRQGWYNGDRVWYVPFAASDILIARQLDQFARIRHEAPVNGVDWTPALQCALSEDLVGDIYFINCAQTTVFSTEPGLLDYTPLWRVHYLEWAPDLPQIPLTAEADVKAAIVAGDLIETRLPSVLDATIPIPSSGAPSEQLAELNFAESEVEFYAFKVHFVTKDTLKREVRLVLITDISDPDAAEALKANLAPRLVNADPDCCGLIYAFSDPVPPGQYPIIDQVQCIKTFGSVQTNLNRFYTPVLCWTLFDRGTLAPYVVINNRRYADFLSSAGIISQIAAGPIVSNSPVTLFEDK